MKLAFDRASVRSKDVDGRLHIAITNISAASVDDYLGSEVVNWQELGLDPAKVYGVYRPAEELEKAVRTFDRLPVLLGHAHATALDPKKDMVIGSTGESAEFDNPYLRNSMVVWDQAAIESIESRETADLSCGYYYQSRLENGDFNGKPYSVRMTNIIGSHLAVVPNGRVQGALIQDSALSIEKAIQQMAKAKKAPSSMTLLAQVAFQALGPKMAADSKEGFKKLAETELTHVTWKTVKPELVKLKLAQDADAKDVEIVLQALDAAAEEEEKKQAEDEDDEDDKSKAKTAEDEDDPVMQMLKTKGLSADEMKMVKDSMGVRGMGGAQDEDDEEAKEKAKQAADAEKEEQEMKDKQAMDAAIAAAVKVAQDAARAQSEAEKFVRPYVGELAIACDSAEAVYKAALDTLKIDVNGVHPSAYRSILAVVPKPGIETRQPSKIAMDAKPDDDFKARFPNAGRLAAH